MENSDNLYKNTEISINISLHELSTLCLGLLRGLTLHTSLDESKDAWLAKEFTAHLSITREEASSIFEKFYEILNEKIENTRVKNEDLITTRESLILNLDDTPSKEDLKKLVDEGLISREDFEKLVDAMNNNDNL